jgi:hypothetical protein
MSNTLAFVTGIKNRIFLFLASYDALLLTRREERKRNYGAQLSRKLFFFCPISLLAQPRATTRETSFVSNDWLLDKQVSMAIPRQQGCQMANYYLYLGVFLLNFYL